MSFFSMSSKRKHYQNGHQGSGHYKRKGLMGSLMDIVMSRSHSHGYYENQHYSNTINHPVQNIQGVNCSKCGSIVPQGSKFCLECGEKISGAAFCLNCGEKLPAGAKFCNNCGSKV
ncbi:MAG: zinc ribbon domain-containing protein [Solirubrobacterales bacterium]